MIVCSYVRNSLAGRIGCAELVACSPGISLPLGSERGLKRGATLCPSSHPVLVESSAFGKGDRPMKVIGNLDEHTDGCWSALDPVSCHRGRGPFIFGTRPNLFQGCLPARRGRYRTRRATRSWPGQLHEARRLRRHVRTAGIHSPGLAARGPRSKQLLCPGRGCAPVPGPAGGRSAMKFRVVHQPASNHARSPFRVVEQTTDREVDWINRFLDRECLRRVADITLRSYAHHLLYFLRWWESVHHTGEIDEGLITESTLLDYVRFQSAQQPQLSGSTINQRVAVADRALRAVPGFVELITSIQST